MNRLTALAGLLALLALAVGTSVFLSGAPGAAATMPAFDAISHPYVQRATTDKAVYAPGASGNILISLRNPEAFPLAATIATSISLNAAQVRQVMSAVTVPPMKTAQVVVPFTVPNSDDRGYRVGIIVTDPRGKTVDHAMTAIDVQGSKIHARFPRQCWVSRWDKAIDAASLIASQIAWHCNTVQGYALYYRPELAPPPSMSSWPSLSNLTVSRTTVRDVIAAAHAANMPVGFFQATGEAYSGWRSQPIKPDLSWGSFRNRCGLRGSCTQDDLDRSPQQPDNWTRFGWQADHLDFFDPCSPGWQQFLISRSISPMMEQFAFDFWQADTVGAPVQPTYDSKGRPIDTVRCLSDFTSGAAARLGKPVILNNVSGWGMADAASTGRQPYLYRETWNFDTPYYPGLNGIVSGAPDAIRRQTRRAIVQPGYINRTLAEQCSTGARAAGCTVNANSARLATAMFAIAGSTWMNHPDDGCIMTNVFVEGYHLPCSASVTSALLSYKAFEVGYQNLLRDTVTDSTEACEITSGAKGGVIGAAGEVYALGKTRPGFQICHLLNLTGVSSNDWTDLDGTKEKPTELSGVAMKLYYFGDAVVRGRNRLWWASPDYAAGAPQSLNYKTGSDANGNYVTFTLPGLRYWNQIVLETSLVGNDLAIDARKPIRGAWLGTASAGIASANDRAITSCCRNQAGYRQVQFGQSAASIVGITYTASAPTVITLRLGSSAGEVLGSCHLPAGRMATVTCPVKATRGLHDLFMEFEGPAELHSFRFS